MRIFDVVVIGAGPAGEHVAARTAAAGLNTVVVEAVLRPRDRTSGGRHDLPRAQRPERAGITLVRGHGRLSGPRIVEVTGTDGAVLRLSALHAVAVCTGTRAALPPLPGLAALRPWTSREAAGATKVPPRLAIVGGGVAAVEMATAWQALGSQVTLVVPESGLLPRVERFAADLVTDALRASGVELRFDTTLSAATRAADVRLALSDGAVLHADELLLAAGRAPRTDDLGLETVGLRPGAWLPSDDTYTVPGVTGDWLYAVGDVNQRALLTHQGRYQARIAGTVIADRARNHPLDRRPWSRHTGTADHVAVPQVLLTDPEIAFVGLTAADAVRLGRDVDIVDLDLGLVAGAHQHSPGQRGRARILLDPARGTLLGATFAGRGVAGLLQSATFAIAGEIPLDRLRHAVPALPTLSEVWLRLLETHRDTTAPPPGGR
ncbi:dihydrolipoamide dehydrogenase [Nonomuraea thailandensis]|uniref:Dihydrolipoamide dehydrogenase n=1 Tax=Nonomuraea thailandensis TaxID=1188745 RepID=A0A9X2GMC2_9ACTN|nr:NAD(P)/FAD-dependent oxidoreductase [Nonomuraea thailandensis]MCP2356923.1 dihydrolipoamide dehydrogenase [Nonomuraea thailandensis]